MSNSSMYVGWDDDDEEGELLILDAGPANNLSANLSECPGN